MKLYEENKKLYAKNYKFPQHIQKELVGSFKSLVSDKSSAGYDRLKNFIKDGFVVNHNRLKKLKHDLKNMGREEYRNVRGSLLDKFIEDNMVADDKLAKQNKKNVGDLKRSKIDSAYVSLTENENLLDGVADGLTLDSLIEKNILKYGENNHIKIEKILKHNFYLGIKTETEHTGDKNVAKEIALDHLFEDMNYYVKLRKSGL